MPVSEPAILLVDNGSLEPAATLSLRRIASALGAAVGQRVHPVSLLHSSAIDPRRIEGRAAEILEPAIAKRAAGGVSTFLVVPLFFGPSAALTRYLPERISALRARHPGLTVRVAHPLVDGSADSDEAIAGILESHVRAKLSGLARAPSLIVVDHGSPTREVAQVRDRVTGRLKARLGAAVGPVQAASMERRPGPEYAFADPLLEQVLGTGGFDAGPVIIAMLFVSPGRHAGPEGDVAKICAAAEQRHPGLRTIMTDLVGAHPGLIDLLARRVREERESVRL